MDIRFILLLHILTNSEIFSSVIANSKWKRRKEECKISQDKVTGEQEIYTLKRCIASCEIQSNCETVSWQIGGNTCLFSAINMVDDKRRRYVKWELSDGWVTYSRVNYPGDSVV